MRSRCRRSHFSVRDVKVDLPSLLSLQFLCGSLSGCSTSPGNGTEAPYSSVDCPSSHCNGRQWERNPLNICQHIQLRRSKCFLKLLLHDVLILPHQWNRFRTDSHRFPAVFNIGNCAFAARFGANLRPLMQLLIF